MTHTERPTSGLLLALEIAVAVITLAGVIVTLIGIASADFEVASSSMRAYVPQNSVTLITVNVRRVWWYKHAVILNASDLPDGITITFNPAEESRPPFSTTMIVTVGDQVPAGSYPIIIEGLGANGIEHSTGFSIVVPTTPTPMPTYTESPSPTIAPTATDTEVPSLVAPAATDTAIEVPTPSPGSDTTPTPVATTPTTAVLNPTNTPVAALDIFAGGALSDTFALGVSDSLGRTDWITMTGDHIRMAYPNENILWGAVCIMTHSPDGSHPGMNLSDYRTLSLELRGEAGGEEIIIGVKDSQDPDDGSESKYPIVDLTTEWTTYAIPLTEFKTADLSQVNVPIELVFETGRPEVVEVRNIRYLP